MSDHTISVNLPSSAQQLLEVSTDFKKLQQFLPYCQDINIIEKNGVTKTEELFTFKYRGISYSIRQQTVTKKIDDKIEAEIISGPLKGTLVETLYEEIESGTKVIVNINLKISLKYKFLSPEINKRVKMGTMALLYKLNSTIESD